MTAPSETPLTDAAKISVVQPHHEGDRHFYAVRVDFARSLETALAESQAEADKQRQIAANWENMAAMYKMERDEARAECERLRIAADDAHLSCVAAEEERELLRKRLSAAEAREREAYERAAKVCFDRAQVWLTAKGTERDPTGIAQAEALLCAEAVRALADERGSYRD